MGWVEFWGAALFAGCGFLCHAERGAHEERADRNRPARKGKSRIRKPAPLKTTRVAPVSSKPLKGCATRPTDIIQLLLIVNGHVVKMLAVGVRPLRRNRHDFSVLETTTFDV